MTHGCGSGRPIILPCGLLPDPRSLMRRCGIVCKKWTAMQPDPNALHHADNLDVLRSYIG
jgi:hypothetical protein